MATINVGDLVRITDRGYNYPHWRDMFETLGFGNNNERDNPYDDGTTLQVFAKIMHPQRAGKILYGLEPKEGGGTQILMECSGLEYVFPGNWHIKVTEENTEMLGSWRQASMLDTTDGYILSEHNNQRGYWVAIERSIPTHCQIEISTEQFIEYVLDQTPTNMPEQPPMPEQTSNLENEAQDEVLVTTEKVICLTDKWNYVNLGSVYEVTKRDEYYTYVKDEVGGESRYAHHYFEEWVHEDLRAKRDQFRNLFGDHSARMFLDSGDEVKKLLAELYPKLYKYNDWIKLTRADNNLSYTPLKAQSNSYYPVVLMNEDITTNESLHGYLRFDHNDIEMNTFISKGYTYIRFRPRH
jgi:hypothetical protein